MDTSDPEIAFDPNGICNHCRFFDEKVVPRWFPDDRGQALIKAMLEEVRSQGKGKRYDSIIGLSGGVDSCYVAVKAVEWGLRPLVVHVDAGWNSELAIRNIERIVTRLDLDLHTIVIDWEEMRDLQLAFLRANVANQDTPQDHVFFASLYDYAAGNGFDYLLNGANYATESILPRAWGYSAMDGRHLKHIHRRFGERPLSSFPVVGFFRLNIYYRYLRRLKVISPLNYMPYRKSEAIAYLEKEYDWRYYGGKHYESRWTQFFQSYYLTTKFSYDKRRAHLASLVLAGEMSRDEALRELAKPPYSDNEITAQKAFVAKKLRIPIDELEELISQPPRDYREYANNEALLNFLVAIGRTAVGAAQMAKRFRNGLK
jgi:N-acetyl sugar amidotransferase